MDVLALGSGLSWRRVGVLVSSLPEDGLLPRALVAESGPSVVTDDDEARLWRLEHHLLANVIDLLAAANWQRGGGKGQRPKPFDRPGRKSSEQVIKKRSSLSQEEKLAALRAVGPPREGSV